MIKHSTNIDSLNLPIVASIAMYEFTKMHRELCNNFLFLHIYLFEKLGMIINDVKNHDLIC